MKDRGEDHFEVVHNNVTDVKLAVELEEYVKHDIPFAKNKTVLTSKNLLEKCACYLKYKMHSQLRSSHQGVLLQILHRRSYILDAK